MEGENESNVSQSGESMRSGYAEGTRDSAVFLQSFLDKKNLDKNPTFLILTIHESGEQSYTNMTLRDILKLLQDEISPLCAASHSSSDDVIAVSEVKYRDIRRMESILSAHEEPAILVSNYSVHVYGCVLLLCVILFVVDIQV
jgi:hypothetical protein